MDDPRHARPAQPSAVATSLDDADIHVWWLPRQRDEGRAPLLRVLAGYLGTRPEAIALGVNPHGRPRLDGALAGHLDFNWSHSGEHAVIAVAHHLPALGVDIERVRPRRSYMALAERFFAASEHALLASLPEDQRLPAFVRLWTAKEAMLKAHGRGLAYGLD
ncbi:MAG TPA: 4'-phosphopantetheinyl transferase superfamily protein, partial [Rhodanobacteraceae bacterium]|nr:4'-phosphopantetheinyl transferase superfamily protein [Rhodanobacteraceae bacterium]